MIKRSEYMDGKYSWREYNAQFVTNHIKSVVESRIGLDRIKRSKDPHLNDIPLLEWDICGTIFNNSRLNKQMRDCGDYTTKAGLVCIAKEAARQLVEES